MQFKKKKLYSINPLRDLFEDYIDPKKFLKKKEDVEKVNKAMQVVREFLDAAEEVGIFK